MEDCIFCKIVNGQIPCYKIYEDDNFLGFLDIQPLNPGNTLLIPKKHFRWVDDVEDYGQYWQTARRVGRAIIKSMKAVSINYLTVGEEVPHAHIRIIPRYKNDKSPIEIFPQKLPDKQMKTIAEKISTSFDK